MEFAPVVVLMVFAQMYYGVGVETACVFLVEMSREEPLVAAESMMCVAVAVYLAAIGAELGILVRWTSRTLVAGRFRRLFALGCRTFIYAVLASGVIYGFANRLLDLSVLQHSMIWGALGILTSPWLGSDPGEVRRFILGAIMVACLCLSLAFVVSVVRLQPTRSVVVFEASKLSDAPNGDSDHLSAPILFDEAWITASYNPSHDRDEGPEEVEDIPEEIIPGLSEVLSMPFEPPTTPDVPEPNAGRLISHKAENAVAASESENDAESIYESVDGFSEGEEDEGIEKNEQGVDENKLKEKAESHTDLDAIIDLNAILIGLASMSITSRQDEDEIGERDTESEITAVILSRSSGPTTFSAVEAPVVTTALTTAADSPDIAEKAHPTPVVEDTIKETRDTKQQVAVAIQDTIEAHTGTACDTPITAFVAPISAPVEHPKAPQNNNSLVDEPSQQAELADEEAIAGPRVSLPNKTSQPSIPETAVPGADVPIKYEQDKDGEHEENHGDSTNLELTSTISTISTSGSTLTMYPVVDAAATAATLTTTFDYVDRIFEEFMAELAADAIALEKKMAEWAATEWQVLALKGPACTPKVKVDINENPAQAPESDEPLDTHAPTDPPTDTVDASPEPPALVPAVSEPQQPGLLPSADATDPTETTPDVGAPPVTLEEHSGQDLTLIHDQEPAAEEGEVEAGSVEVGQPAIAAEEPEGVGIEEQQPQPVAEQTVGQEVTAPPSSLAPAGAVLLEVNAGMGPSSLAAAGPMDIPTALPLLAPAPQPAIGLSWTPMGFLGSSPAIRDVGMAPPPRRISAFARPVPSRPYDPSNRRSYYKSRAHITTLKKWARPSFLPLGIPIPPAPRWTQLSRVSAFGSVAPPVTYDSTSEVSYYKSRAWMTALRKQCRACFPGYETSSFVPQVEIPPVPASWTSPPAPIPTVPTWTNPERVSAFDGVAPLKKNGPTSELSYYKHRAWVAALRKQCRTWFPGYDQAPWLVPRVAIPAVPVSWSSLPTA
ncbi:hypothetical protein FRC07_007101 [Ceratobasidium sp. 392]|nr:hypothetical protein FRC07_007101 [Ceratobasidium sp. 392]